MYLCGESEIYLYIYISMMRNEVCFCLVFEGENKNKTRKRKSQQTMSLGLGIPGAEGGTHGNGDRSAWAEVWGAFRSPKRERPSYDVRSTCLSVSRSSSPSPWSWPFRPSPLDLPLGVSWLFRNLSSDTRNFLPPRGSRFLEFSSHNLHAGSILDSVQ